MAQQSSYVLIHARRTLQHLLFSGTNMFIRSLRTVSYTNSYASAASGICYCICISITSQALCLFIAAFARLCRWWFSTRKPYPPLVKTCRVHLFISIGGSKMDEYSLEQLLLYFIGAIRKIYNFKRATELLVICRQCCFDIYTFSLSITKHS